jgi:hypothetical protein
MDALPPPSGTHTQQHDMRLALCFAIRGKPLRLPELWVELEVEPSAARSIPLKLECTRNHTVGLDPMHAPAYLGLPEGGEGQGLRGPQGNEPQPCWPGPQSNPAACPVTHLHPAPPHTLALLSHLSQARPTSFVIDCCQKNDLKISPLHFIYSERISGILKSVQSTKKGDENLKYFQILFGVQVRQLCRKLPTEKL